MEEAGATTASYKTSYAQPFASTTNGFNTSGTAYINLSQQVTSQAVTVSINNVF